MEDGSVPDGSVPDGGRAGRRDASRRRRAAELAPVVAPLLLAGGLLRVAPAVPDAAFVVWCGAMVLVAVAFAAAFRTAVRGSGRGVARPGRVTSAVTRGRQASRDRPQ